MNPSEIESPRVRTKLVRLRDSLADKLSEIVEVEGITSTEFLEPLVAAEIENRHRANASAINVLRKARERAAKLRDEPPVLANDLGGEAGGA